MDEDMELIPVWEVHEVDLDYEFDAPVFFDFTCEESLSELHSAQAWFNNAPSYPPSPFVSKLVWIDQNSSLQEAAGSSECISYLDYEIRVDHEDCNEIHTRVVSSSQSCMPDGLSLPLGHSQGLIPSLGSLKNTKHVIKQKSFKSSTLMKPTASILAKNTCLPKRFHKPVRERNAVQPTCSAAESQAIKKQKLDCGLARKVGQAKQQCEFIHKEPKRNLNTNKASVPKNRVTIPREPQFATAKRVHKIRNLTETSTEHGFKARPLNRKILEAPLFPLPKRSTPKLPTFQEFNFKTSERAMQHATSSYSHNETKKSDLWKKDPTSTLLSRKQDKGTKALASRRAANNPPVELFSKLSLASKVHNSERSPLRQNFMNAKDTKENQLPQFNPQHNEIAHLKGGENAK